MGRGEDEGEKRDETRRDESGQDDMKRICARTMREGMRGKRQEEEQHAPERVGLVR